MMKRVVLFCLATALSASAFSYSCFYGASTGSKTLSICQFIYGDTTGFVGSDLLLGYGITDKFDVTSTISINNIGPVTWAVMPRMEIVKGLLGAVRFSDSYLSPQMHGVWDITTLFTLQANAAVQLTYDYMARPAVYGVVCPILKIPRTPIDVSCDVVPVYTAQDQDVVLGFLRDRGFSLDVVPSVGLSIGTCLFSLAAPIANVNRHPVPSFGAWWLFILSGK